METQGGVPWSWGAYPGRSRGAPLSPSQRGKLQQRPGRGLDEARLWQLWAHARWITPTLEETMMVLRDTQQRASVLEIPRCRPVKLNTLLTPANNDKPYAKPHIVAAVRCITRLLYKLGLAGGIWGLAATSSAGIRSGSWQPPANRSSLEWTGASLRAWHLGP